MALAELVGMEGATGLAGIAPQHGVSRLDLRSVVAHGVYGIMITHAMMSAWSLSHTGDGRRKCIRCGWARSAVCSALLGGPVPAAVDVSVAVGAAAHAWNRDNAAASRGSSKSRTVNQSTGAAVVPGVAPTASSGVVVVPGIVCPVRCASQIMARRAS